MCVFKKRKRLEEEIKSLKKKLQDAETENTAKKNIIRQQDERIEKLKKRVKTQQDIIEKQNAKLGVETKKKKKSGEAVVTPLPNIRKYTKDEDLHDPFPEE